MKSLIGILASALLLAAAPVATPALAQAAGEKGPARIVWAAHKGRTPYTGVNKPVYAYRRHPEGASGQAELGPAGDADPRL